MLTLSAELIHGVSNGLKVPYYVVRFGGVFDLAPQTCTHEIHGSISEHSGSREIMDEVCKFVRVKF